MQLAGTNPTDRRYLHFGLIIGFGFVIQISVEIPRPSVLGALLIAVPIQEAIQQGVKVDGLFL